MSNMNQKLQTMIEGALVACLGVVLAFIPVQFGPGNAFDLSLGLIPLGIYGIRRGLPPALIAGLVWALMKGIIGQWYILSPVQVGLDYIIPFTFAGFLGVFSRQTLSAIREKRAGALLLWVSASSIIGVFSRWIWHFIAGFLVWGEYAPDGQSPVIYSLLFNGASFIGNVIMLVCILTLLARWAPIVFLYGLPRESQKSVA